MTDADADAVADRLETALRARWDAGSEVTGLEQLAGGASRQTWQVEVATPSGPAGLVLQRAVGEVVGQQVPPATQAGLLQLAEEAGVPVPPVQLVLEPDDDLGEGFVTDFVPGEARPTRVLRDETLADARAGLAAACGRVLASLHTIDPDRATGLVDFTTDGGALEHNLDQLTAVMDGIGEPHPVLELAIRWLRTHPPTPHGRVVVHGDFRNGNLLVAPTGLVGVLDWELAHVGDPLEDLGWLCVRAWRFGADHLPVGGFGTREDLVAAYARSSGRDVDVADVRRWELLGTVRWGVICMLQASRHLDGCEASLELAAIGRRVCETEYDVLGLLAELAPETYPDVTVGPDDAPPPGEPLVTDQDRPAAHQLLAAMADHLADAVVPELDGRTRFHTQVATNACRILEREVRLGPALARRADERFRPLVGRDDAPRATLAAGLRDGTIAHRDDAVAAALRADAIDRLHIANPGYLLTSD